MNCFLSFEARTRNETPAGRTLPKVVLLLHRSALTSANPGSTIAGQAILDALRIVSIASNQRFRSLIDLRTSLSIPQVTLTP